MLTGLCITVNAAEEGVTATPFSMDFYGFIPSVQPGDVLTVLDADGVVCGLFTVKVSGQYGFVHVYGDDPATAEDEGARMGDQLTFLLNNKAKLVFQYVVVNKGKSPTPYNK